MYQKQVLEKWLKQIKTDEIKPDALGLGIDKEKAIEKLREQINQLTNSKKFKKY